MTTAQAFVLLGAMILLGAVILWWTLFRK